MSEATRRVVSVGREGAAEEARRRRYLRVSRVGEHSVELHGRFANADFMWVDAVLQPLARRAFIEARSSGQREGAGAYMADALVEMGKLAGVAGTAGVGAARSAGGPGGAGTGGAGGPRGTDDGGVADVARAAGANISGAKTNTGADMASAGGDAGHSGRPRAPGRIKATVNVVVDHAVLVRGSVEPGERCEVVGLGPLPVSTVNQMLNDCFLNVLATRGRDVLSMGSESRYLPSGVRASLALRDPVCSVRGCDVTIGLEIDHRHEIRHGGKSTQANLHYLCSFHHRGKSLGRLRLEEPNDEGTVGEYIVVPLTEGKDFSEGGQAGTGLFADTG